MFNVHAPLTANAQRTEGDSYIAVLSMVCHHLPRIYMYAWLVVVIKSTVVQWLRVYRCGGTDEITHNSSFKLHQLPHSPVHPCITDNFLERELGEAQTERKQAGLLTEINVKTGPHTAAKQWPSLE